MTDQESIKHYWLYVLKLEQNKYYIGSTSRKDPYVRIKEHMNGFYTSQWVRLYKPVEAIEVRDVGALTAAQARNEEKKLTIEYIKRYGLKNVRGADINYSGDYVRLFGRMVRDTDFKTVSIIIFFLAIILILLVRN